MPDGEARGSALCLGDRDGIEHGAAPLCRGGGGTLAARMEMSSRLSCGQQKGKNQQEKHKNTVDKSKKK